MTNTERIEAITQALTAYDADDPGQPEEITDLLADLMHYCEEEKIDFNYCLQNAQMHYGEERHET